MNRTARAIRAHYKLLVMATAFGVSSGCLRAEPIKTSIPPDATHGFIVIRNASGVILASGDVVQIPLGDRMKARVILHFADGSLDDETTLYFRKTLRLIRDHHIQRGRSFPEPVDYTIDLPAQRVSLRTVSNGKLVVTSEAMELPPDLSNGIIFGLVQSLPPDSPKVEVPYLAASTKLRLVKLAISPEAEETFKIGGRPYNAMRFVVKVNLGGLTGIIAPMIGKQPSDMHAWVLESNVPAILRVDGALYTGGPTWSMQMASPSW